MSNSKLVSWMLAESLVALSFGGALAFLLARSARRTQLLKERRALELEKLAARPLQAIRPQAGLLHGNEVAYAAISATLKEVHTVGYSGASSGVSVRVTKGVTVHGGRTRGHAVKRALPVSSGEAVVTDQRIIFAGDVKSFTIPLAKLINVKNHVDGIAFHQEHKTYLLACSDRAACDAFAMTVKKVRDEEFNPYIGQVRQAVG